MKLPSILNLMTDDLAIDLGTSRTRVFARGRGIVVNEPSLLAYDQPSQEVVAVGLEALELVTRHEASVDRRRAILRLTPKAETLLAALSATHCEEIRRLKPLLANLLAKFG